MANLVQFETPNPILLPYSLKEKALYALHIYTSIQLQSQLQQSNKAANFYADQIRKAESLALQIQKYDASHIKGIVDIKKKCSEFILNIKSERPSQQNDGLTTQMLCTKSIIKECIAKLQNAAHDKQFKQVEQILVSTIELPQACQTITQRNYSLGKAIYEKAQLLQYIREELRGVYENAIKENESNENCSCMAIRQAYLKSNSCESNKDAKVKIIYELETENTLREEHHPEDISVALPAKRAKAKPKSKKTQKRKKIDETTTYTPSENQLNPNDYAYLIIPHSEQIILYDIHSSGIKYLTHLKQAEYLPINFATCIHHQCIYITGGKEKSYPLKCGRCYSLKLFTNYYSLKLLGDMITAREKHSMASDQSSSLFVVGGCDNCHDGEISTCEEYNTNADQWKQLPMLKKERRGATAIVQLKYIYVIGGMNKQHMINTIERLSISDKKSWEPVTFKDEQIKRAFLMGGAAIDMNTILLFGGYKDGSGKECYVLDTEAMVAKSSNDMIKSDYFFQRWPSVSSNNVYMIGNERPYSIHIYNAERRAWSSTSVELA